MALPPLHPRVGGSNGGHSMRLGDPHREYSIGDLSRQAGVNIETIRYYERTSLIPRPPRTQSGRRAFGPDALKTLMFIKRGRELGFGLNDIRKLLSLRNATQPCSDAQAIAKRHLDDMRLKMRRWKQLEQMLASAVAECPGESSPACTVLGLLESGPEPRA